MHAQSHTQWQTDKKTQKNIKVYNKKNTYKLNNKWTNTRTHTDTQTNTNTHTHTHIHTHTQTQLNIHTKKT